MSIDNRATLVGRRVFFDPEPSSCDFYGQQLAHKGQLCYVVRGPKGGTYDIRFEDGFECDAYASELYL